MSANLMGSSTEAWSLHDSNEIDRNSGFIPDVSGSFEGRARVDSASKTFNVIGGAFYPIDIKRAESTGAVGVTELLIVRTDDAVASRTV